MWQHKNSRHSYYQVSVCQFGVITAMTVWFISHTVFLIYLIWQSASTYTTFLKWAVCVYRAQLTHKKELWGERADDKVKCKLFLTMKTFFKTIFKTIPALTKMKCYKIQNCDNLHRTIFILFAIFLFLIYIVECMKELLVYKILFFLFIYRSRSYYTRKLKY